MSADLARFSAAMTHAQALLDALANVDPAHAAAAEQLRVHGPEVLALARSGADLRTAHSAELADLRDQVAKLQGRRDCRECEYHPHADHAGTNRFHNGG